MSEKLALIIATSQYQDTALRQLVAPAQDAESLARVLGDPAVGGFQVRTLVNEPSHKVSLEIESFCDDRKRDDLLLLYFSCHGIKDTDGLLYFATIDTKLVQHNVRRATAVGAEFVNQVMSRSRSRRQILLLDCCYSGAFREGMLAKGGKGVGVGEQFQGQGRVVLTASDALQYSFEGEQVQGEGARSVFTHMLVRGLETGEADLDRDGSYSLDEVYDYLYARVSDEQPEQKPMKMGYMEGKIFIGSNPRPRPAELPLELQESLVDSRTWVRLGAVQELEKLLAAHSKGLFLAAQDALTALAKGDDSFQVRTAADRCLAALAETRAARSEESADDHAVEATGRAGEDEVRRARERLEAERLATETHEASANERIARERAEREMAEAQVEHSRLEQKRKHAVEQNAPAGSDVREQKGRVTLFSKLPAWAKVAVTVFGVFIIAFALSWAWLRWRPSQQAGEAEKQQPPAETSKPHAGAPQPGPTVEEGDTLRTDEPARKAPAEVLRSWKMQRGGIFANAHLRSVAFATPQLGWAVGYSTTILHTEDGGNSWKMQSSGINEKLLCVAFVTAQSGWVVGNGGTILHTEDGGGSWKMQSSKNGILASVAFATPRLGWVVGYGGTILHTEDGGGSWRMQSSGTRANLHSIAFATPRSGWAVGDNGTILHTEDGGGSWKMQSGRTTADLHSIAFATPRSGWAVGDYGTILHTEDGGGSWKMQRSGTPPDLYSVAFVTPQSGWAVGGGDNVLHTQSGGIILHTQDGGSSWKTQNSPTGTSLSSVTFATPQSGWAVGDDGTILHWN